MFKRLEIKKFFALLMVACLLLAGVMAMPATAYADPEDDPAVTEQVTEGTQEDGEAAEGAAAQPSATQEASGIKVDVADDEEEDVNPMDAILSVDRIILDVWAKICSRLAIIIGILLACVIGIIIYIMVTQTTKISKQNKELERRPSRQLGAAQQPAVMDPQPQRQVKQFGDTLRIRRTMTQGAPAQTNMQRPAAPQRPSRPAQGTVQPGVRRPVQGQPVRRPVQGQPQRPMQGAPQAGQPVRRPVQGQPQRPVQGQTNGQPARRPVQGQPQRPVQPVARPTQQSNQPPQK